MSLRLLGKICKICNLNSPFYSVLSVGTKQFRGKNKSKLFCMVLMTDYESINISSDFFYVCFVALKSTLWIKRRPENPLFFAWLSVIASFGGLAVSYCGKFYAGNRSTNEKFFSKEIICKANSPPSFLHWLTIFFTFKLI